MLNFAQILIGVFQSALEIPCVCYTTTTICCDAVTVGTDRVAAQNGLLRQRRESNKYINKKAATLHCKVAA